MDRNRCRDMTLQLNTTFGNGGWNEQFSQKICFRPGESENCVINLYPEITYQVMDGFGGAVTDAAAFVYSQMDEQQKKQMMEAYFSPEHMNYQMIRVPIDSCDFSREQYEAWNDGGTLNFDRLDRVIVPMLRDAEIIAGRKLPLILAPWSPPAFMKTNGIREQGGKLRPEYREAYAEYLCQYIEEYQKRGFCVAWITLQNEPKAVQTWDSCIYTAQEEKSFLCDCMCPAMKRHGLESIQVFIWDHNKERVYEWMRDIIDDETDHMVAGAAVHWYSGDHFELLDLCREHFPDKKLILSESCIELYKYESDDVFSVVGTFAHEIIGDLNHGINFFCDWNMLLDEHGGPNYVGNYCLAPFMYDIREKKLMPQLLQQYIEHFAHSIQPGSIRIAFSRYTDKIDVTAWKRPDGSVAMVMLNRSKEVLPVCVRLAGEEADLLLRPKSISSAVIEI